MEERFEAALKTFLVGAQKMVDEHHAINFPNLPYRSILRSDGGKKYLRIVTEDVYHENGKKDRPQVFCFLDIATGDVLKAATWRAPAKHARGNIYAEDNGMGGISAYGGRYLK
jgi:hypothetical protein